MKKIICYGDSNTFGFDSKNFGRLDECDRWCGILRKEFQDKAEIINMGLNGRTIKTDDLTRPDRNAYKTVEDDLSGAESDLIIIMLGTNDCKFDFRHSPERIASDMEEFIRKVKDIIKTSSPLSEILLISPVPMNENCVSSPLEFDMESFIVSTQLSDKYRVIAQNENIHFADASEWNVELSFDGCHYTPDGHKTFAENIVKVIEKIL